MSDAAFIRVTWTGDAFRPASGFHARLAGEKWRPGDVLVIEAQHERSKRSHNHYFATLNDLWANLPETLAGADYAASPDLLRKRALIATGFANCETLVAGSKADATRAAALMSALARKAHGYAITEADGAVVRVWTPQSQSYRDMGAQRFAQSKARVLDWIGELIEGRVS
jgi:hypothetical protein